MNRRGFITGLISLVAAPAIVRAASIMPVKPIVLPLYGVSPAMPALPDVAELEAMRCRIENAYFLQLFKVLHDQPNLTAMQIVDQLNERNLLVRA